MKSKKARHYQMTAGDLREALSGVPSDLPIFFRRIAPICGNIEGAGRIKKDKYGFFGLSLPCLIIEPMK